MTDAGEQTQPSKRAKIIGKFSSLPVKSWIQQNGIDMEENEIENKEDTQQDTSEDEETNNADDIQNDIDIMKEENNKNI